MPVLRALLACIAAAEFTIGAISYPGAKAIPPVAAAATYLAIIRAQRRHVRIDPNDTESDRP